MKNVLKNSIALLMSATFMISMAACKNEDKKTEKEISAAKGRYVEEEVNFPADISGNGKVYAFGKLEDNSLRLVAGSNKEPIQIYSSKDEGKTWDNIHIASSIIPSGNKLSDAAIDKKGNMVIAYGLPLIVDGKESLVLDGKASYLKLSADGKSSPINISLPSADKNVNNGINNLRSLKIADNGDYFGVSDTGSIYQIDPNTYKIKNTYKSKNTVYQYSIVGNTMLAVTNKGVEQYDISSGRQLDNIKILADYLTGGETGKTNKCLVTQGNEEKEIYFCNDKGLYRHILGGTIVEQLVDGSLSMLSSVDMNYIYMTAMTENNFFILYNNNDSKVSLMKYSYSQNTPVAPKKEITVYSLKDNRTIRQEITLFQKANPDIHVIFETGLNQKDAVSPQDAIKTLNTEILAGKGPDVLVLDNMPLASYMDKGILVDISDVIGDYSKKGELFDNIAGAYKNEKKIYAAPIRFEVPVINSKKDTLSQIKDLKTLADYSVRFRDNNSKDLLLDIYSSESLMRQQFSVNADSFINKDGSLDKNKLTDFFNDTKKIFDASIKGRSAEDLEAYNQKKIITSSAVGPLYKTHGFDYIWAFDIGKGRVNMNIGSIGTFLDLAYLTSALTKYPEVSYKPINDGAGYFIPDTIVGINGKNGDSESAKKFVSYLFGKEAQEVSVDSGFPVNKAAFEEGKKEKDLSDARSALGNEYVLQWPSNDQFKEFTQMVQGLKTPVYNNNIILDAVLEVSDKCMSGKISVDEAVTSVMKKVNLYLSE